MGIILDKSIETNSKFKISLLYVFKTTINTAAQINTPCITTVTAFNICAKILIRFQNQHAKPVLTNKNNKPIKGTTKTDNHFPKKSTPK